MNSQHENIKSFLLARFSGGELRQLHRLAMDGALPVTKNRAEVDEPKELVQQLLSKLSSMVDDETLATIRDTLKKIAPDAVADLDWGGGESESKADKAMDEAFRARDNFSSRWPSIAAISVS